jgi:xylulokinase
VTVGDVFVGLDLGTSGLKAAAMTPDGGLVATASAAYPTHRPAPGRAEQDPADWWAAATSAVASLAAVVPAERWAALGLSAMLPTLVTADPGGTPVGPAITWEDDRADRDGERIREATGAGALYTETGQWVDGRYLLSMFRWLEREEPARTAGVARILGAKDHLFQRLTGEVATDPSTATGFGCYELGSGTWDGSIAGPEAASRLPAVRATTFTAPLRAEAAASLGLPTGMPVALGAADSVCGVLGAGATSHGARVSLWGTSTAILGLSEDLVLDGGHRFLVTPLALGSGWGLEMDLISTGSALAWLADLLGRPQDELLGSAASAPPGANGVTFLPYLGFGEQGALWDPSLRGVVNGLTLAHGAADLARALMEGIALEVRRCLRVLDQAGVPAGPMIVAGGAAGSEMFTAMLAGASGAPVHRVADERWISARGAAIVAATSVALTEVPVPRTVSTIGPVARDGAIWDELEARAARLLDAVRPRR